jgi:hypothetical protein
MTKRVSATTIPLLLKSLLDKPQTALGLVASTGLGADGVHKFIAAMKKEGLLHVVRWDYKVTQPVAVYAFGYGVNTRERWNDTQTKLFDLFGDALISYDSAQLSEKLNLKRSTISKAMNELVRHGFFTQNPGKATAPVSWRRNLDVALPDRGAVTSNAGYKPAPAPRPAQQSWFSAITR